MTPAEIDDLRARAALADALADELKTCIARLDSMTRNLEIALRELANLRLRVRHIRSQVTQ